jgi:hypothetical protein
MGTHFRLHCWHEPAKLPDHELAELYTMTSRLQQETGDTFIEWPEYPSVNINLGKDLSQTHDGLVAVAAVVRSWPGKHIMPRLIVEICEAYAKHAPRDDNGFYAEGTNAYRLAQKLETLIGCQFDLQII